MRRYLVLDYNLQAAGYVHISRNWYLYNRGLVEYDRETMWKYARKYVNGKLPPKYPSPAITEINDVV